MSTKAENISALHISWIFRLYLLYFDQALVSLLMLCGSKQERLCTMRVAAVTLVLIVGAAMVLVFANTLNSWVLGGLLGGLAALLLSIPISLALFTLLARRHNTFLHTRHRSFEDEPAFAEDLYHEQVVYEAEFSYNDEHEHVPGDPRARYLLEERSLPASGYLRLPAAEHDLDAYEDEQASAVRHEPRNYPRQPRSSSRIQTSVQTSHLPQHPVRGETSQQYSTHALSQHQSEALRVARQEAQRQRSGSSSLSRHTQESRTQALQRARASRQLRARRPLDERDTWLNEPEDEPSSRYEEEDLSFNQFSERSQHDPRSTSYPRQSRFRHGSTAETRQSWYEDTQELNEPPVQRSRYVAERMSDNVRYPLVRRASYLSDEDPAEFTQQFENDPPTNRRASRHQRHERYEE